jgi:hypothetical protein
MRSAFQGPRGRSPPRTPHNHRVHARTIGLELEHAIGERGQEAPVVRHQQQRALVVGERADQHLLGGEVEVVGGLVEHEEVGRVVEHARHHQAHLLAAGEQPAALGGVVAREAERRGERAQRADRRVRERLLERLPDRLVAVEQLHRVLREVALHHGAAHGHAARVGRRDAGDELQERRLARAVRAHHAPALAAPDQQIEAAEDRPLAPRLVHAREPQHVLARARRGSELELDALALLRRGDLLDLLDLLHARLHLRGVARPGLEARDERLLLGEHRLLARILRLLLALGERALALVEVVVPGIGDQVAAVDLEDLADHAVQELAVVRGHHQRALERAQPVLEPQDRLEVEVVGGLIEQQRVRLHDQDPREPDAHLPAARERADVAVHLLGREAEAREHGARARLEPVAAERLEARLRLAVALDERVELALPLRVGERVLELVQLARRFGHGARAVERGLEHGLILELADVLAEVSDRRAAVDRDLPGVGLLLARDQPEDRGLAGAVRSDQPDLLAAVHRGRGLEEQDLRAVALGDGVDADHDAVLPGRAGRVAQTPVRVEGRPGSAAHPHPYLVRNTNNERIDH